MLDSPMKMPTGPLWLAVILMVASFGVAACSSPAQLPADARRALMAYWESLDSAGVGHQIIRAWPGEFGAQELAPGAAPTEIWCVEAAMSAPADPSVDGEVLVWIVTRENGRAPWSAAMLASLSATWPYEACGQAPGSHGGNRPTH